MHGIPMTILTYRDKVFMSHFLRQLFKLSGKTLTMSSSYHLPSNGQYMRLLTLARKCICDVLLIQSSATHKEILFSDKKKIKL